MKNMSDQRPKRENIKREYDGYGRDFMEYSFAD